MKRVFLDTNILLDALETGRPRHQDGLDILTLAGNGRIEAVVSSQSIVDVAYIYTKGQKVRLSSLKTLVKHFDDILSIRETNRRNLMMAAAHFTDDYEDALQASIALDAECEVIVTGDRDFDEPFGIPVVSPDEFCRMIK